MLLIKYTQLINAEIEFHFILFNFIIDRNITHTSVLISTRLVDLLPTVHHVSLALDKNLIHFLV
jgi:hypothetical protein